MKPKTLIRRCKRCEKCFETIRKHTTFCPPCNKNSKKNALSNNDIVLNKEGTPLEIIDINNRSEFLSAMPTWFARLMNVKKD